MTDTDDDGLTDAVEVNKYNTDPDATDTDSAGLTDAEEVQIYNSSPVRVDTDSDGLNDSVEIQGVTAVDRADTDSDSINDSLERELDTDPTEADTDADGLTDEREYQIGTNPTEADSDGDGLSDAFEYRSLGSSPVHADTDSDGLNDSLEHRLGTNPTLDDTDGDGLSDAREHRLQTSPTNPDLDGDGLSDSTEVNGPTLPTVVDTDGDGFSDAFEWNRERYDAISIDTDSDGLYDGAERANNTNPSVADTDDDGLSDAVEVKQYDSDPTDPVTVHNGLTDAEQAAFGLNPADDPTVGELDQRVGNIYQTNRIQNPSIGADTDGDGFTDAAERDSAVLSAERKDIVVEVAWTKGNAPQAASLLKVQQAYNQSPVDGGNGVALHFVVRGEVDARQNITANEFYNDYYQRTSSDNRGVHHALYTDTVYADGEEYGGFSVYRIAGFVVAHQDSASKGRTTMHELGHSLGLTAEAYRGIDSYDVSIEAYPSVMNYNSATSCAFNDAYCYQYSDGTGYDDWAVIEERMEDGCVTPDGSYDVRRCQ